MRHKRINVGSMPGSGFHVPHIVRSMPGSGFHVRLHKFAFPGAGFHVPRGACLTQVKVSKINKNFLI